MEIVHLEADLHEVIRWAEGGGIRWAFSLSNAGSYDAEFGTGSERLRELDWHAIGARQWQDSAVRDRKQAEFLVHERFPWRLIRRVGVSGPALRTRTLKTLEGASLVPLVEVRRDWYY